MLFNEEESSGEEDPSSFFYCTSPWILDDNCQSGGIGKEGGVQRGGKGKEPHWAAEEEEESSDNLDCLRHVGMQYSDSHTRGDHLSAGLEEGLWPGTKNESDVAEKEWGHSPASTLSCLPTGTVSSRSPSQESEVLFVLDDTE